LDRDDYFPLVQHSISATKKIAELETLVVGFKTENEQLAAQRDQYKILYHDMLELCRKLERGILAGQKREKLPKDEEQLTLKLLGMLLGNQAPEPPLEVEQVKAHERAKPTGRKPLPENLPRVDIEVIPPEVQEKGLESFERIGEDVTETVERRPGSLVVVRVHRPKFVLKDRERGGETKVSQSPPMELGLPGPGLLADSVVKRWQDHLPMYRMERIYGRDGLELARSTICGWHGALALLARPVVDAMWADAMHSPYLCTDATGVLVQALEKCRCAHFFVVAAPEKHVLFGYAPKHNSAAVDDLLRDYKGYLVADAHTVYDHLYRKGDVTEVGCWAHTRRYYFKSLSSDPERAKTALAYIKALFQIERNYATAPPEVRHKVRQEQAKPIVEDYFDWCDAQAPVVLDETPISKAIGYSRNQREALQRFLEDGRLPIHNNFSERQLRREAVGRKNWLFLGNDEGGETNATFVSLLASCQLHELEPLGYLRDLFCLLPSWPNRRVLELAPAYWRTTLANEETQRRLAANVHRQVSLGSPLPAQVTL
jgi:transposase